MEIPTLSVSEIVHEIKANLESEYTQLAIEGEISNLSGSAAGHYYLTLSDKHAGISCALFKGDALRNPIIRRLKDGDKVIVQGSIGVYAKRGTFQIIAKRIVPAGKGDLKAQFEKLKQKFIAKGYFDENIKKEIPKLAKNIAIITALKGAALQDFLNVMKRRCVWYNLTIIPAVVQGDGCPSSVIKGINQAEELAKFDVLVIARGGGSMEDLWGFNDEELIERAFKCQIPIISAIGHQVDFSLLDFVSDLRCETPTSAAEVLSHEHTILRERLKNSAKNLRLLTIELKSIVERKLQNIHPLRVLNLLKTNIHNSAMRLEKLNISLRPDPIRIYEFAQNIDDLMTRMFGVVENKCKDQLYDLEKRHSRLTALDPSSVLKRGYSIVSQKDGKLLTSSRDFAKISLKETLQIRFSDGVGEVKKIKDEI